MKPNLKFSIELPPCRPLGFYIRDGTSVRVTPAGLEKVPGIFISRLVPGGLAESTGLLAVNDEVLEVNGIEVAGKSLDQGGGNAKDFKNRHKKNSKKTCMFVHCGPLNCSMDNGSSKLFWLVSFYI